MPCWCYEHRTRNCCGEGDCQWPGGHRRASDGSGFFPGHPDVRRFGHTDCDHLVDFRTGHLVDSCVDLVGAGFDNDHSGCDIDADNTDIRSDVASVSDLCSCHVADADHRTDHADFGPEFADICSEHIDHRPDLDRIFIESLVIDHIDRAAHSWPGVWSDGLDGSDSRKWDWVRRGGCRLCDTSSDSSCWGPG